MKSLIAILLLLAGLGLSAQSRPELDSLTKTLEKVYDDDQSVREDFNNIVSTHMKDSVFMLGWARKMVAQDSINQEILSRVIEKYGWLGKGKVTPKANDAEFYVIQHAPIEYQLKYLPLVKKAMLEGNVKKGEYAILVDRTNMGQGKFQIYGSQLNYDTEGRLHIFPIIDEPNVDKRRRSVGLPPMKDYVKMFNPEFEYKRPLRDFLRSKKVVIGNVVTAGAKTEVKDVGIYLQGRQFLGQTDSTGFFQVSIDRAQEGRQVFFRKKGFQDLKITVPKDDRDVYKLTPLLIKQ